MIKTGLADSSAVADTNSDNVRLIWRDIDTIYPIPNFVLSISSPF